MLAIAHSQTRLVPELIAQSRKAISISLADLRTANAAEAGELNEVLFAGVKIVYTLTRDQFEPRTMLLYAQTEPDKWNVFFSLTNLQYAHLRVALSPTESSLNISFYDQTLGGWETLAKIYPELVPRMNPQAN
jgi:hypothetical protein